jgi:uncharacterized protein YdeI (YjbR/CyaY-like superfamily)
VNNKEQPVDRYIEKSLNFAKPILKHLRKLVHKACPQVEETIKWGFPHFEYRGMLCGMASFKQHCVFGFWKATLLTDRNKILNPVGETAMGQFGKIRTLQDLPADEILIDYIKEAVKLNEDGIKIEKKPKICEKQPIDIPDDFLLAIQNNKNAVTNFSNFSNTYKKEYIEWITDAKTEKTRHKRIATAIEWIIEGKSRNWKYMKK